MVIQPAIGEPRTDRAPGADSEPAGSTAPGNGTAPRRDLLLCRVAGRLVALPVGLVVETMRPLPVQRLPGLPGYVAGVAMIRGTGTPVLDLGALLGSASTGRTGPSATGRFVTVRVGSPGSGGRAVALAVDAVLDVRSLDAAATGALPPLLGTVENGLVASLGSLDPDLLYVLEPAHLVDDDVWAGVAGVVP